MMRREEDAQMSEGITRKLAEFSSRVTFEDLSPEVLDWAKYLCLDFVASL